MAIEVFITALKLLLQNAVGGDYVDASIKNLFSSLAQDSSPDNVAASNTLCRMFLEQVLFWNAINMSIKYWYFY